MGVRIPVLLLALLGLAGCVTAPPEQPPDLDPYTPIHEDGFGWIEGPRLPFAVAGAACTLFEDAVWMFGGIDAAGFVTGQAARFSHEDSARGQWNTLVSMPRSAHGATAAPVGDRIHIVGGYQANGRMAVSDRVTEYVPSSGLYNIAPIGGLDQPLAEGTFLIFDGVPSIGGGTTDGIIANDRIRSWDPVIASAGWHAVDQRLPNARAAGAFGESPEGFFAAAGGWATDGGVPVQDAEIINWNNGRTIPIDGLPTPRRDAGTGHWEHRIAVVGGSEGGELVPTVELLDLTDKAWYSVIDLPTPLARSCVVGMDDGLHVMGGVGPSGGSTNEHWILQEIE